MDVHLDATVGFRPHFWPRAPLALSVPDLHSAASTILPSTHHLGLKQGSFGGTSPFNDGLQGQGHESSEVCDSIPQDEFVMLEKYIEILSYVAQLETSSSLQIHIQPQCPKPSVESFLDAAA